MGVKCPGYKYGNELWNNLWTLVPHGIIRHAENWTVFSSRKLHVMTRGTAFEGKTILYVEDDPLLARETIEHLNSLVFHEILVASDLREAVDAMKGKAIDIAFMDVHVGAATTIDLAPDLAAKGTTIVFTSGYSREELGDRLGEFAFLPKPYSRTQLLIALDETLSDQSGNLAAE